jgi:hypothetical protein
MIPADFIYQGERAHSHARGEGIAGRYGHRPCLRRGGCGTIEVCQHKAGHARPRQSLGPLGAGEQGRLACLLQLAESITRLPARQQDVPEAYSDGTLHGSVVVPAKQRTAGRLGVGDPPGPHQAAGSFGEQPVAAGIPGCHQPGRLAQQVRGDLR